MYLMKHKLICLNKKKWFLVSNWVLITIGQMKLSCLKVKYAKVVKKDECNLKAVAIILLWELEANYKFRINWHSLTNIPCVTVIVQFTHLVMI